MAPIPPTTRSVRAGTFLLTLVVLGVLGFLVHAFFVTVFRVQHAGMFPTIKADGFFLAKRRPYTASTDVQRGDVVVFDRTNAASETRYVWRVVGLPGDAVRMEGTNVWINGQLLVHERVRDTEDAAIWRETNAGKQYEVAYDKHADHPGLPMRLTVPALQFFVLGDNRFEAQDSTYLGFVHFEEIVAKKF